MASDYSKQRQYKLSIQDSKTGEILVITNPLTLEFDIIRNNFSALNSANLSIFNLSEKNRNFVRKDLFDSTMQRNVRLEIGYGDNLSLAYQGTITKSYSIRSGVNFITHIESLDGYYQSLNSIYENTFEKGTPKKDIIADILLKLSKAGLYTGSISLTDEKITRKLTFNGNTFDILKSFTKGKFFIDNSHVNILTEEQAVLADIVVVDGDNIINTPTLENTLLRIEILLDTTVVAAQRLKINSTKFDNRYSGLYRICGITHKGIISETTVGKTTTLLTCNPGKYTPVGKPEGLSG